MASKRAERPLAARLQGALNDLASAEKLCGQNRPLDGALVQVWVAAQAVKGDMPGTVLCTADGPFALLGAPRLSKRRLSERLQLAHAQHRVL